MGQNAGHSWPHGPRQLVATLVWLRLCAIGGQLVTIVFVAQVLGLAIPVARLLTAIAVLGAFNILVVWRLRQKSRMAGWEPVAHIAIDTLVLGYLLYLTGGASNPFVSLLVMPITLAATALPLRSVATVATLAVATYLVLMRFFVVLPEVSDAGSSGLFFNLHLTGMAISFAITAGMLGFFIARLARALRAQQAEAELEHVRALRDEGILAIATQAASTAHELNTPLSTIRPLLGELARDNTASASLKDDFQLLIGQADRCRDILRELVKVGSNQLAGIAEWISVAELCAATQDSFNLLRPEAEARFTIDGTVGARRIEVVPALHHAIVNLLNNAADASLANGDARVEMTASADHDTLEIQVRDYGRGMHAAPRPGSGFGFQTTKHNGLGLGLALANATAERFGGTLNAEAAVGGGTRQCLRLPLAKLYNPPHER